MTVIIAGRFEQQDEVQEAISALQRAGAPPSQISSFYVNPPGQHDMFPIGGDRDESPGAEDSDKGCLLYTSPSPRDQRGSRMPSSA